MLYRIMLAMSFDKYDEAHDFYDDIKNMIPKANPQIDDFANWHRCFNTESTIKPCEIIEQWEPD